VGVGRVKNPHWKKEKAGGKGNVVWKESTPQVPTSGKKNSTKSYTAPRPHKKKEDQRLWPKQPNFGGGTRAVPESGKTTIGDNTWGEKKSI